jgi:hypothetical protein
MILSLAFLSFVLSFSMLGCYEEDKLGTSKTGITQKGSPFSLKDCINACLSLDSSLSIVAASLSGSSEAKSYCRCLASTYKQIVNVAECQLNCSDGFACGGFLQKASLYNVTDEDLIDHNQVSVNTGNRSINTCLIAVIVFTSLALLVLLVLAINFYLRYRKRMKTNNYSLPRLPSDGSGTFLIRHLPRTKGLIYSAPKSYIPVKADELAVSIGDVVAVRKLFDDGWCDAINISTGANGILTLSCLVPPKQGRIVNIKDRNQSLTQHSISMFEPEKKSKHVLVTKSSFENVQG